MAVAGLRHAVTATALMDAALAHTTKAAYNRVQEQLATFLRRRAFSPLSPVTVVELIDFLSAKFEAGCSPSTLATAVSATAHGHRQAGLPDPTVAFHVRQLLAGARRLHTSADRRLALSHRELAQLCGAMGSLPISPVDRSAFVAIFSLAFFAMLRPGEVVVGANPAHTVRLRHVELRAGQLAVTIPSSKTSTS